MRLGIVALLLVGGCSTFAKKTDSDAGASGTVVSSSTDPVDAAPVPQPAVLATNQGDIARFPDETALANVRSTFMRAYNIRESPLAGTVIIGLPKGAVVTQIAQRTTYFLILFDNPKQAATQLMGWVSKDAFSTVVADAGAPVCVVGETALLSDSAFCGRICTSDADCTPGTSCRGSATRLAKTTDAVKVCVALGPASTSTVDASTVPTDGGLASSPDAGGPAQDVVAALPGSKCPGNFVFVTKTGRCHRPCTTSTSKTECRNNPYFCDKCDVDMKHVCLESHTQCQAK